MWESRRFPVIWWVAFLQVSHSKPVVVGEETSNHAHPFVKHVVRTFWGQGKWGRKIPLRILLKLALWILHTVRHCFFVTLPSSSPLSLAPQRSQCRCPNKTPRGSYMCLQHSTQMCSLSSPACRKPKLHVCLHCQQCALRSELQILGGSCEVLSARLPPKPQPPCPHPLQATLTPILTSYCCWTWMERGQGKGKIRLYLPAPPIFQLQRDICGQSHSSASLVFFLEPIRGARSRMNLTAWTICLNRTIDLHQATGFCFVLFLNPSF